MVSLQYFDSHCHLQLRQYDADRAEVIARMRAAGVGGLVVGVDYATSKAAIELAKDHDFLWVSVGLHPNDNPDETFDAAAYEELAKHPKVVAIGECGLDYFRSKPDGQQERFEKQIVLAQKLNKALIVHCRNAHDDVLEILSRRLQSKVGTPTEASGQNTGIAAKVPVVMHFFTGTAELAKKYLDLGCYLSFPGPITYTDMYDDSIRVCPPERMLVETDAPFAAPVPYRGKRNEPAYVEHVAAKIAAVKGITRQEAAGAIVANAQTVFGAQVGGAGLQE